MFVEIYTDGACSMPNRNGGYAAVLKYGDYIKEWSGGQLHTTNNQMELQGVILGLSKLKRPVDLVIFSDSKYVVNGINAWMKNWKANTWKTADGKVVKNQEKWKQIDQLLQKHVHYDAVWVRGHDGNEFNERANELAQEARDEIKRKTLKLAQEARDEIKKKILKKAGLLK